MIIPPHSNPSPPQAGLGRRFRGGLARHPDRPGHGPVGRQRLHARGTTPRRSTTTPALVSPDATLRGSYADVWTQARVRPVRAAHVVLWRALARSAQSQYRRSRDPRPTTSVFHAGGLAGAHAAAVLVVFSSSAACSPAGWPPPPARRLRRPPLQVEAVAGRSAPKTSWPASSARAPLPLPARRPRHRHAGRGRRLRRRPACSCWRCSPSRPRMGSSGDGRGASTAGCPARSAPVLRAIAGLAGARRLLAHGRRPPPPSPPTASPTSPGGGAPRRRPTRSAFYLWKPSDRRPGPELGRRRRRPARRGTAPGRYIAWLLPATVALIAWRTCAAPPAHRRRNPARRSRGPPSSSRPGRGPGARARPVHVPGNVDRRRHHTCTCR